MRTDGWLRDLIVLATATFIAAMVGLAMSHLIHGAKGAQGVQGKQGQAGATGDMLKVIRTAHLGICVVYNPPTDNFTFVKFIHPMLTDYGVESCADGTFVSVKPETGTP